MNNIFAYIWEQITTNRILTSVIILVLSAIVVVTLTELFFDYNDNFYWELLVEAHGMILDIFVIGVLALWLNILGERRLEIKRAKEDIEDFRGWKSEEAKHKIIGTLKRLNRRGVKSIDLHDCYLQGAIFEGIDLRGANLWNVDFRKSQLKNADFCTCEIGESDFSNSIMNDSNFSIANIWASNFNEARLFSANFTKVNARGSRFRKAKMDRAVFKDADLSDVDFTGAQLYGVLFENVDFMNTIFTNADLEGARFINIRNLKVEQLSDVYSLFRVEMDEEFIQKIVNEMPELFETKVII